MLLVSSAMEQRDLQEQIIDLSLSLKNPHLHSRSLERHEKDAYKDLSTPSSSPLWQSFEGEDGGGGKDWEGVHVQESFKEDGGGGEEGGGGTQ